VINTVFKNLTDYQTFIVFDSGESMLTFYHKITPDMLFDFKYDMRHKARLLEVGNWTINETEDIFSGVLRMDTVRIEFFSRIVLISCCVYDIGNIFLYGKTREKFLILSDPEFGENVCEETSHQ
jgi:hypothetical protein